MSRSSSLRKRALGERKGLDVDLELLPSKHKRYVRMPLGYNTKLATVSHMHARTCNYLSLVASWPASCSSG